MFVHLSTHGFHMYRLQLSCYSCSEEEELVLRSRQLLRKWVQYVIGKYH